VAVEQRPGGVFYRSGGELVADFSLHEAGLSLGQLRLGLENEKYRLGSELVLAFFRLEGFLGQVSSDLRRGHGKFGLFELMNGVTHLLGDGLFGLPQEVEVVAPADQSTPQVGLGGPVFDGKG